MFCRHCGKELYEGAFFCTNCGTPVNQLDLLAREAVSAPVAGAGAQEDSGTGTIELIPKMQLPAVQAAEVLTQTPEVAGPEVIADTSVEPNAGIQERADMPGQAVAQGSSAAAASEVLEQAELTETPAQSSMSVQESATEDASKQEMPEQPESAETMAAAAITPQRKDAVLFQAASAAAPESSQPQKPRERNKVAFTIITVVAAVLFLAGVWGAIYFSGGEDKLLYSQEELPVETERPEWSGLVEPEETKEPGETMVPGATEKPEAPEETEAPEESGKPDEAAEPEASAEPGETEEPEWSEPWFEEQEGSDFSGRDVYPDMYGYGEGVAGDAMHTYWFDYTVTRAYVCDEFEGYAPAAGNELLLVEIVVKNTFNRSIPMFDTDFQVQWNDDAPDAYEWPVSNSEYLSDIILPEEYTLKVEERIKGYLLYEVPAGYSEFSLSYLEEFADDSTGDTFFLYFTATRMGGSVSL